MKKLILLITTLITLTLNTLITFAEPTNITGRSYLVLDSQSGQVLYGFNLEQKKLFPASTTKIMTAIVALENGKLDQIMKATESAIYDIGKDGMNIGIMAGEELRMEDLLNALLVCSANETANIIAENICPTRKDFVDLMNKKAQEIGAFDTHFTNPCGKHDNNHYTTAVDLAKIGRYAMTIPKFREIVCKTEYNMSPTNKHSTWNPLYTTNKLLWRKPNELFTVNGIKTGYTDPAGHNFVSSAINSDGMELISVIMGSPDRNIFNNAQEMFKYGFENYSLQTIVEKDKIIKNVEVAGAIDNKKLNLLTSNELKYVLPRDKSKFNIAQTINVKSSINAPVKKGDIMGYIEYKKDGLIIGKINLIASDSIEKSFYAKSKDFFNGSTFKNIVKSLVALIIAFFALRFTLKRISKMSRCKNRKL